MLTEEEIQRKIQQQGAFNELFSSESSYSRGAGELYELLDKDLTEQEKQFPLIRQMLEAYQLISEDPFARFYEEREGVRCYHCNEGESKPVDQLTETDISHILQQINNQWKSEQIQKRLAAQCFIQAYNIGSAPFEAIERIKGEKEAALKTKTESSLDRIDDTIEFKECSIMLNNPLMPTKRALAMSMVLKGLEESFSKQPLISDLVKTLLSENKPWIEYNFGLLKAEYSHDSSFDAINAWLQAKENFRLAQLKSICEEHLDKLYKYKSFITQKYDKKAEKKSYGEFYQLKMHSIEEEKKTGRVIQVLNNLLKDLKNNNLPASRRIDDFLDKLTEEKYDLSENTIYNTLKAAHKGRTFWEKLKEFFGLTPNRENLYAFFKSALESPEEKTEQQQNIEAMHIIRTLR